MLVAVDAADALVEASGEALVVAASGTAVSDSAWPVAFSLADAEVLALADVEAATDALALAFAVEVAVAVPLAEAEGLAVLVVLPAAVSVRTGRKYRCAVAPMASTVVCEYWPGISTSIVFEPSWVTVASLTP